MNAKSRSGAEGDRVLVQVGFMADRASLTAESRLNVQLGMVCINRAALLSHEALHEEACAEARRAVELMSGFWTARRSLIGALELSGKEAEAEHEFRNLADSPAELRREAAGHMLRDADLDGLCSRVDICGHLRVDMPDT